jgi:hypothetical protein
LRHGGRVAWCVAWHALTTSVREFKRVSRLDRERMVSKDPVHLHRRGHLGWESL